MGIVDRYLSYSLNPILQSIRKMWHDLYCLPQVISFPLSCQDVHVYLASCDIVILGQRNVQIPLVITQVQIDFATIIQDVDFAMFFRVHCPRIDVKIGVDLDSSDFQSSSLEQ